MNVKEQYQPIAHTEKSGEKNYQTFKNMQTSANKIQYLLQHINFLVMKSHPATTASDHSNFNTQYVIHYACTFSVCSILQILPLHFLKIAVHGLLTFRHRASCI